MRTSNWLDSVPNWKRVLVAVAVVSTLMVVAGGRTASAGTYSVHQCDYQRAITNSSFAWQSLGVPALTQHANSGCTEFGLAARTSGIGTAQTYADGARGGYVVNAPSNTVFTRFTGSFGTLTSCCVTGMEPYAEAVEFTDGSGSRDEFFRGSLGQLSWQAPPSQGPVTIEWAGSEAGFPARRIGYFLGCSRASGCPQSTAGDMRVRGRTFEFRLDDLQAPEVSSVEGDLLSGGWVRGVRSLAISAVDQGGGLAGMSAMIGGQVVLEAPSTCAEVDGRYVDLRPCPLTRSGSWFVDTREASDGPTSMRVSIDDVGGARTEESRLVWIDNTPPAAPASLAVEGGQGWRSTNSFSVRWDEAGAQHAPITRVHSKLCKVPDGPCGVGVYGAESGDTVHFDVPGPGAYSLRLWLEDEAGNVDPGSQSDAVSLMFDDEVPGRAHVEGPRRWLGAAQSERVDVSLGLAPGAYEPISRIAGYSTTTNGSGPDASIEVASSVPTYEMGGLPEGETTVKARAISGAGVQAASVGTASIRIDRSPPLVAVEGPPGAPGWQRTPVSFEIASMDQVGLSGVQAASIERPVDEGGYIALRLDSGAVDEVRGDRAAMEVAEDGRHTITYRAFDAAGNGSVQKEAVFRIDGTAPVGAFRVLDPGDPRTLKVDVEDVTSGIAGGRIEYRRQGESGFRQLGTAVGPGVLSARLDDEGLPVGRYEVRAVVTDVAGNEAVIDKWADGSPTTLGMPLRLGASLEVAGKVKVKRCSKAAKKKRGKGRRKRASRPRCRRKPVARKALELRHGRRALSRGRLTSGQGVPLADARVVVEGQARSGGPFTRLGVARTDVHGRFGFTIPPGPSRTVRYRYDGTNTTRPAAAELTTKVRAAARLKADRRRLRNGQVVRFTGRLLGKPIPAAGKVVALQAKVGRGWRTFATPRANARGVFRYRYRFTSTTGTRRYRFRAAIAREGAYPYEAGVSPIVRVRVRGR